MNPQNQKPFIDPNASARVHRSQSELASLHAAEDLQDANDALEIAKFVAMSNGINMNTKKMVIDSGSGLDQVVFGPDGKPVRQRGEADPNMVYKHLVQVANHNRQHAHEMPVPMLAGTHKQSNIPVPNNMQGIPNRASVPQSMPVSQSKPIQPQHSIPPLLHNQNQMELNFEEKTISQPPVQSDENVKSLAEKVEKIEEKLNKMDSIEQMLKLLLQNNAPKV